MSATNSMALERTRRRAALGNSNSRQKPKNVRLTNAESTPEGCRHHTRLDRSWDGTRALSDFLWLGQGHCRTGRQQRDPIAAPDVAAYDRNARPPPSGKDRQSAFALACRRAATRFLGRYTGTVELRSLC